MKFKLLPCKYKILGEVLILTGLIILLALAFFFPMDSSSTVLQLVMSVFILICYAGIIVIAFSRERVENEFVMHLRYKSAICVALFYFFAFIVFDVCQIWITSSIWNIYVNLLHTAPFIYYLVFRILYRNLK